MQAHQLLLVSFSNCMQTRRLLRDILLLLLLDSSCLSLCLHSFQVLLQVAVLHDQVLMLLLLLVCSSVCTALYTLELLKQSMMLRRQLLVLCLLLLL